jgi:hypothetical protein
VQRYQNNSVRFQLEKPEAFQYAPVPIEFPTGIQSFPRISTNSMKLAECGVIWHLSIVS